ncbi:hypothetical protein SAMN05446037_10556 [Anaerovirgula multivorans]|uniref:Uncharacterized protein n=1 Tax=Anaerovirgula multivorans TaxID=312168 RepID=A0A239KWB4_9FIRM|nr:hypothetical protein [Anaerovirgula multivorans]SNT21928.1 hypothetical protein SAMN05446037_10556 [Anaerovirgula multivorans]
MNVKFKKIFSVLLIVVMMISSFSIAFADEVNDEELSKPVEMILVENGVPRVITFDELEKIYPANILSESLMPNEDVIDFKTPSDEGDLVTPMSTTFYKYVEKSGKDSINYNDSKAVTPWIDGGQDGSSVSYGESITHTSSFGVSATVEINAILATLGASYVKSSSNSTSFGATFTIGANKRARVRFAPTTRASEGTVQTWRQLEGELNPRLISEKAASSTVVRKVGNFADGLYYLEYQ